MGLQVRRRLVPAVWLVAAGVASAQLRDDITALSAVELAAQIAMGRISAEETTRAFMARIAALDDTGPALNAIIEINPDAVAVAQSLDRRLRRRGAVGPLHGVPVVLKANIDTADRLATNAGSLALAAHHADRDAVVVERLRAAGAVILGKANLSEWANFRSSRSTSGWSSVGGQTRNPYVLDRNPCGSSSGSAVAVAARLAPLALGTETDGSIVCPAGANGIVGIKPTHGLVGQRGIVPIAPSQDTAGPMARTVADAALLLGALLEPGAASTELAAAAPSYATARASLAGVRIGVLRDYLGAGRDPNVDGIYAKAVAVLRDAGAQIVDPIALPLDSEVVNAELELLLTEFRASIDRYLAAVERGPRSLAELIEFNDAHAAEVLPHFGQELFVEAQQRAGLDAPSYRAALDAAARFRAALERLFGEQRLDALVAPTNGRAWRTDWEKGDAYSLGSSRIAAVSGYPSITVPAALLHELPIGVSFIGRPWGEAGLLRIAAAFEHARGEFPAPRFLVSIDD
jgi:amidase